jgi:hypothetical protein
MVPFFFIILDKIPQFLLPSCAISTLLLSIPFVSCAVIDHTYPASLAFGTMPTQNIDHRA